VDASLLNRRDFVKMAVAAGLAAVMAPEVLPAKVGEQEPAKPDPVNPIRVDSEWGRLREVIVGIVPDNAIVPPPVSSHFKEDSPQAVTCFQQCHEKPAKQALPEAFTAGRRQVEALVKIYEKTGIKVHRPRPNTETELDLFRMGGAPLYARDSMLVVGQNVIELSLRDPSRRKEIFAYREMLARRLAQAPRAQYASMPPPLPAPATEDDEGPGPFLEGGDIFLLGKDILVGNSGQASNEAGIGWLQRFLGPQGYRVQEVPLTDNWLHLDCVLAVIRPGLAMAVTTAFRDGLPGPIQEWEIIEASPEEGHALGVNAMCLAPDVVVMGDEHQRLIKELKRREVEVVSGFRTDVVALWGGGVRCLSNPLLRNNQQ
jgi:N-dimethylarginine dimethylaminohydrolase